MILLSVIIPVYNAAPYLEECVESIYRQDLKEGCFEVLLINDGSTDRSAEVMEAIAARRPEVRCIHQTNQGVSVARNHGICEAKGQTVALMDADDVWMPRTLGPMLDTALTLNTDMTRGALQQIPDEKMASVQSAATSRPAASPKVMTGEEALTSLYPTTDYNSVIYIYRREFLTEQGLTFRPGIRVAEDLDFVLHCLLRARRFVDTGITFYAYRIHANSCITSMNLAKLKDLNTILGILAEERIPAARHSAIAAKLCGIFHAQLNYEVWYLTHHRSLFASRREAMHDLRKKVHRWPRGASLGQQAAGLALRLTPLLYLKCRALLALHKYE